MTNKIKSYQDLLVWQRSMGLVETIYRITGQLPENERFGSISQMRRAAVSVPSRIADPLLSDITEISKKHATLTSRLR